MYSTGHASVVHPRLSVLSTSSLPSEHSSLSASSSSTRFSLPPTSGTGTPVPMPSSASVLTLSKTPLTATNVNRPNIYDRPLNKTKTSEVSLAAFAFLFSEMIQYTQKRVNGIADFERRLNTLGYRMGLKLLELYAWRTEGVSRAPKRETRFLTALSTIGNSMWKSFFGRAVDAIQKSVTVDDEFMLTENEPAITKFISISKDMGILSCSALTAGVVEAILDGLGFPARVTAHNVPTETYPNCTTILIKLDRSVLDREEALK
ncbi:TRAPP subunit trs31 [Serendipita sp. 401]|nr:TRAPP subunit trs31 [Serendipita sp. 397]KAG8824721.1 TRAPP subunit trs31 [Serendipita sp. 401]KAG9053198.1 TRAPP subunit trs31 [Serendipita sp. 407]